MNNLETINKELADILSVTPDDLIPSLVLEGSEYWDSLAQVSVIAMIINLTGVKVTNEEIQKLTSVQDIYDLITVKLTAETEVALQS